MRVQKSRSRRGDRIIILVSVNDLTEKKEILKEMKKARRKSKRLSKDIDYELISI